MFANLLAIERTKIIKRRIFWVLLAILTGLVLEQIASHYFTAVRVGAPSPAVAPMWPQMKEMAIRATVWPTSFAPLLTNAGQLGSFFLVILVAALAGQEYAWRTVQLALSHGARRPVLILAKGASLAVPVAAFVAVPLLLGSLASAAFSLRLQGALNVAQTNFPQLALQAILTGYGLLPYAAVTLLLAVVSRSVVVALGGAIGFELFEVVLLLSGNTLAGYFPRGLAISLEQLGAGITSGTGPDPAPLRGPMNLGLLDPALAAAMIGLWLVLCLGLAAAIFQRQDLTE